MMKKYLLLLLLAAAGCAPDTAHEVKMLDNGKDGGMVFEPGFLKVQPGDTVTFKPVHKGHWVQSKAVPEGAGEFLSQENQEFTIKFDKEGVYVYTCPPHRMMNMSGIIQVGAATNKAQAQDAADELDNRAIQNKGRLKKYMQMVE